ncbi:uncharacterized protein LOC131604734 [Vicia villosa]|uniref:uncharacterized protein LOC131604734 n=1 Tax=Vicia villosa TaxID=3911 RepID=UPI00273B663E|nr:uncharacterized protein LOC131604734 [Vicia villosa]
MVRVECRAKCGFLKLCSKVGHKHAFAIKTIFDKHTCARVLDNRSASSRAWKAKLTAKRIIEGDADKQYANLRRYAAEGFTNGCKPFVGVDGCHLKMKYGGPLLIIMGREPNDQYFPLAFGVVETETKETWRWFIDLMIEDIGLDKRYVFISDQQKGLVSVFEEMNERVEHRLCLRHLHVVAALGFRQQNPEDFIDECYSREKYKMCYGFAVSPINGQDMWPEVESEELLPPMFNKSPGSPRKIRIRESGEEGSRKMFQGVSYRCAKCDKKKVKTQPTQIVTSQTDGDVTTQADGNPTDATQTTAS